MTRTNRKQNKQVSVVSPVFDSATETDAEGSRKKTSSSIPSPPQKRMSTEPTEEVTVPNNAAKNWQTWHEDPYEYKLTKMRREVRALCSLVAVLAVLCVILLAVNVWVLWLRAPARDASSQSLLPETDGELKFDNGRYSSLCGLSAKTGSFVASRAIWFKIFRFFLASLSARTSSLRYFFPFFFFIGSEFFFFSLLFTLSTRSPVENHAKFGILC